MERTYYLNNAVELVFYSCSGPGNRFCSQLSGERVAGCAFLALGSICESPDITDGFFPNRCYLRTQLDRIIDIPRVARWIDSCTRDHSCLVNEAGGLPGLKSLRLIDVVDNCIVEKPGAVKYVTLSYVWGAVSNIRLTKANRAFLMRRGPLEGVLLPRTILDSVVLVRKLGLRYLWVDSLCLVQNDTEDLQRGVMVMDHIYERSWLTIVAACGHDANSGLVGMHDGDREMEFLVREITPGTFLGVCFDVDAHLKWSVYESRAWTFQEHVLSRRILYFVDGQVFFRCRLAVHLETPITDYALMLHYYMKRVLTNQSDALRAMAGIIRRGSQKLGYKMLEGLPTGSFDQFLLFEGRNIHRRQGFPSYSWAGWRGEAWFDVHDNLNDWLRTRTWIIWYQRRHGEEVRPVWDPAANKSFPFHDMEMELTDFFWPRGKLVGQWGVPCGNVIFDDYEEVDFSESIGLFEVLVLSEANAPLPISAKPSTSWDLYYVLLVERDADGVAERRGIGTIDKESIQSSYPPGPAWKEILLT
ncbi:hypothetical protein MFIFM68171_08853 [Madurella fahalii]|uniref:Heterokaryon incompatibility domain-containing protein n=1 Tax=Madurella fahalii TaxID=1157608 RepID=A0ABQ0GLJ7_9PEZI